MQTHTRFWLGLGTLAAASLSAVAVDSNAARSNQHAPLSSNRVQSEQVEFSSPELARLDQFIGPWRVTETHYNSQGKPIATVQGTEEISWILEHHAIRRSYRTKTETTAYQAIGTLTYNEVDRKYRGIWFDDVSTTGPATVTGKWNEETRTFEFTIESLAKDGSPVKYEVYERFTDEKTRRATTYLLKGDQVTKRLEVQYTRYVPCPSAFVPLPDG